jgi:uncharacterized SAM-binding protein YcdF (DUF218 family)
MPPSIFANSMPGSKPVAAGLVVQLPAATPSPNRSESATTSERGGIISKFIFLVFLVCLIGVVYIARHPLLRLAGSVWIVDDAPVRADAIVVLGDDNFHADRAARAAELFQSGWAPRIVASGRFLRPYASIAELTEHDLKDRGVPVDAIVRLTHRAENTREEIDVVVHLAAQKHWTKLIIVTSNYHTRRTRMICSRMFPESDDVRIVSAPDADYNPENWWQSRLGQKLFLHELVGYVVALWETRGTAGSAPAFSPTR